MEMAIDGRAAIIASLNYAEKVEQAKMILMAVLP